MFSHSEWVMWMLLHYNSGQCGPANITPWLSHFQRCSLRMNIVMWWVQKGIVPYPSKLTLMWSAVMQFYWWWSKCDSFRSIFTLCLVKDASFAVLSELISEFCVLFQPLVTMETTAAPRINLNEPRYDQSTYLGRAKHFAVTTNPLNVLSSSADLDKAKQLVEQYRYSIWPLTSCQDNQSKHVLFITESSLWPFLLFSLPLYPAEPILSYQYITAVVLCNWIRAAFGEPIFSMAIWTHIFSLWFLTQGFTHESKFKGYLNVMSAIFLEI